ncbi:hypothetical protein ACFVTT_21070 [Streptomyces niveus]|uniref:hypothetical protein n=1 Tax=Streptomyces niveus TaxID=193462 RepID=UPI003415F58B
MTDSPPTQGAEPGPPPATPPPPGHPPRQIRGAGFRRFQELTGRRRLVLLSGVSALVLALVAGLLALGGHDSGSDAQQARTERNLQPFKEAIEDLADAPGLRYKDTSTLGITENDITVTAGGSQFGTTASGRNDHGRDVLRIDGKKFTRWQVDPAPGKDVAPGKKAPPSEWIVGLDDGSKLMDEALARTIAPSKLAAVLDKALADLERSPPPNGSKTSSTSGQRPLNVNGTPALAVDTSAGRLLVTKDKPHRVLRLEAYDLRENLSDLRDQLENGGEPTAPRAVTTGPLAAGGAEGMDLTPILADAADKMLDTLVEYADQLKDATDRGITFTLDGAGEMDCSPKGCTATQNFTGKVSSIARKERVTQGEVTAVLSATFTIDGKPAGQCTSPQRTFPVRGNNVSGTLKCSNPAAGPLYASVAARVQAQAQADADACGCRVRLTYPLRANTLIDARALAKVEADRLSEKAELERRARECLTPSTGSSQGATLDSAPSPVVHGEHVIDVRTTLLTHPRTADVASLRAPSNSCGPPVSRQKQDQHVLGTKEYRERLKQSTPTSTFATRNEADAYAQHAWRNGTPVPDRPNMRDYEYGKPVGKGPKGGWQTRVRAHIDGSGRVHAHPVGPEH